MLRFLTSGESHGPELNIILEGIPANMPLLAEDIDIDLRRRQGGYGRGGRMKIEKDKVIFTGGIRHGRTFGGAPIAMKLINKDHQKWLNVMSPAPVDEKDPQVKEELDAKYISKVRPGHADFAGAIKYDAPDVRDILERSSARETTSRVAAGAVCKTFLKQFGIEIFSHVLRVGEHEVNQEAKSWWHNLQNPDDVAEYEKRKAMIEESPFRIYDPEHKQEEVLKDYIDATRKKGDTVGGVLEIFATGLPVGLGSHVQWDRRIDGLVAQAMMSTHTVKSVEIGMGVEVGEVLGSQVHDQIYLNKDLNPPEKVHMQGLQNDENRSLHRVNEDSRNERNAADGTFQTGLRYMRKTNNLGGTEGGMTNGMPLTCVVGVKPIPTLISKLDSVDLDTKAASESHFERSDICVVPAAGVVLEAMMAICLAQAFLEKFGGDSMEEISRNYQGFKEFCASK